MDSVRFPAFVKHPDDNGTNAFIFEHAIDTPEGLTISSVGTIEVRVDSGDDVALTTLVVGAGSPNGVAFEAHDGRTIAIGKAALANVSGGTNGVNYLVKIPVTLSNGRVLAGEAPYYVRR